MTIGIGVIARDGLVIAADSQITVGEDRVSRGKLRAIFCSDPRADDDGNWRVENAGSLIMAGAGQPYGYLSNATDMLIQTFNDNMAVVQDDLRSKLQQSLGDFHEAHVVPYLGLPEVERPSVSLLVGYGRNGRTGMWRSDYSALSNVEFYEAIGSGKPLALSMLETLYRLPVLPLPETVLLASFVLYRVKERNVFCGIDTDMYAIRGHGFGWVDRPLTRRMEALWKEYDRTIEASNFRALLGAPLDGETENAAALRDRYAEVIGILRRRFSG